MAMERIIETDSQEAFIEEIEKVQDVLPKRIDANPKM